MIVQEARLRHGGYHQSSPCVIRVDWATKALGLLRLSLDVLTAHHVARLSDATVAVCQVGAQGSPLVGKITLGRSLLKKVEDGIPMVVDASLPFNPGVSHFVVECYAKDCEIDMRLRVSPRESEIPGSSSISLRVAPPQPSVSFYADFAAERNELSVKGGKTPPLAIQTLSFWLSFVTLESASRLSQTCARVHNLMEQPESWRLPRQSSASSWWLVHFITAHPFKTQRYISGCDENTASAKHILIKHPFRHRIRPLLHPRASATLRVRMPMSPGSVNYVLRDAHEHLFGLCTSYLRQKMIDFEIDEQLLDDSFTALVYNPLNTIFLPVDMPIDMQIELSQSTQYTFA